MPSFSQQEQMEHMMLKTSNSHQQANQQKYPHIKQRASFLIPTSQNKNTQTTWSALCNLQGKSASYAGSARVRVLFRGCLS